jgi:Global regulator protein family.
MLVLNRKIGEDIVIGNNIEIKILDIQENRVKIRDRSTKTDQHPKKRSIRRNSKRK